MRDFNPLDFDGMLDRIIDGEEKLPDSLVVAVMDDGDFDDVVNGIVKERTAFGKLNLLIQRMTWSQKIAVALLAIGEIKTEERLVKLSIGDSRFKFDEPVEAARSLMKELQQETLKEIAIEILESQEDTNF